MPYKIIYTSDLHGNISYYKKLFQKSQESDIKAIILGGDLCPRSYSFQEPVKFQEDFILQFLIPQIKKCNKDTYLIMGNDDFRLNLKQLEESENGNLKLLHKKLHKISDKNIIGYSFVNPTPFRLKDWEKPDFVGEKIPQHLFSEEIRSIQKEYGTIENDLQELKKISNPKKTIYVIHAPPYKTKLDIITTGQNVGSRSIKKFIEKEQPPLTLHGHIHESPQMSGSWMEKIGKTISINVGSSYPKDRLNCVIIEIDNLHDINYFEL